MRIGYSNPTFKARLAEGKYPKELTLGFENEVELMDDCDDIEDAIDRLHIKDEFLYAKEDGSLTNGVEINSHPFNFNWFLENRTILNFTSHLDRNGVAGERTCGFHIHFNRSYFSDKHQRRLLKLVYNSPRFWEKVSQRDGEDSISRFASLTNLLERMRVGELTWSRANKIVREGRTSHYDALDLRGSASTIEFRIFQGTTNPNLIQTYLEVALAMVEYTRQTPFNEITTTKFIQYVYENKALYPKAVRSNILKGKCKYRWDKYQPLTRS